MVARFNPSFSSRRSKARILYVRTRHADAACGMATLGTHRTDSICADAFYGADAANRIGPCSDSKRIQTQIGQKRHYTRFSQLSPMAEGITRKLVAFDVVIED